MKPNDYTPIEITSDAVAFAKSRFGQHYLARLHAAYDRYIQSSQVRDIADSQRTYLTAQAATVKLEIDYFTTAQTVKDDPKLLQRLRDKVNSRRKAQEEEL